MTRRERLERKLEKRAEWAAKAAARSDARFKAARVIADGIPLGQPILVGHHSEGRHRRDIAKIDANMGKGVEEMKLAQHHESKAAGLEAQLDRAIFSDDDNAISELEARIAENEAKRARMVAVNRLYRKGDAAGLAALGLNLDTLRAKLAEAGPYWGSAPHLPYEMSNLSGRIRADRERIKVVKMRTERTEAAEAAGGVSIEGGDYIAVTFAEKPPRATLDALKAAGFRWSGGSWCGYRAKLPAEIQA